MNKSKENVFNEKISDKIINLSVAILVFGTIVFAVGRTFY